MQTTPPHIPLPKEVRHILASLKDAYVVGGCVRDSIMGIIPKDFDITTSALPSEIKSTFRRTIDTGIKHGTVTVVLNRTAYEVTTFRIDGKYQDGRRPESVSFATDIKEDLSRRDFTINAIAYNPNTGLIDPFGGVADINKKNIRCVGEPHQRFSEDALRMMRAIRFCAQLDFDIDPDTYAAISTMAGRLHLISMERIRDELTKILTSQNPEALALLKDTGLWPNILRGVSFCGNLPVSCCGNLSASWFKNCPKEPAMLYALLSADEHLMRHLKFDNRTIKETATYTNRLDQHIPNSRYDIKVILNEIGPRQLNNLLTLKAIVQPQEATHFEAIRDTCDDIIKSNECFSIADLAVTGGDLIASGIPPGEEIGRTLYALLDKVMADPTLNKKEVLVSLCRS